MSDLVGNPVDRFSRVAAHFRHVMRKLDVCIRENKGADQLCSNCTACSNCTVDQRHCFRFIDRIQIFNLLETFYDCSARFESVLAGNPRDTFSGILPRVTFLCSAGPNMNDHAHKFMVKC